MTVQECIEFNLQHFFEHYGRRINEYKRFVAGRDRRQRRSLIGGIGAVGVGQVWVEDDNNYENPKDLPGYIGAPEVEYAGDWTDPQANTEREIEAIHKRNEWLASKN
jgi:hypothetical protein